MKVSIIIVSFNRAGNLVETLASLGEVEVPSGYEVELLIVDNASTDETAQVAANFYAPHLEKKYIYVSDKGKAKACNAVLSLAKGDILLWTDDDVRFPANWIEGMCFPLVSGAADGVAGQVKLAPHLERPWMTKEHFWRLADTRFAAEFPLSMFGANMAFHRRVLAKIPAYDSYLGPGALGFAEDTLFSCQMIEAGFKIVSGEIVVEHHPDVSRLRKENWLRHGEASGRSSAYVFHHWYHQDVRNVRIKLAVKEARLWLHRKMRLLKSKNILQEEGCDTKEMKLIESISFLRYCVTKSTKRNYALRGLILIP